MIAKISEDNFVGLFGNGRSRRILKPQCVATVFDADSLVHLLIGEFAHASSHRWALTWKHGWAKPARRASVSRVHSDANERLSRGTVTMTAAIEVSK